MRDRQKCHRGGLASPAASAFVGVPIGLTFLSSSKRCTARSVHRPALSRSSVRLWRAAPHHRSPLRMAVQEIDSQEQLDKELGEAGDALVVIDFGTTWCGPCKLMDPKIETWSEEYANVRFLRVVGDKSRETSVIMKMAGIRSVPSFHFYKNGKRVHTVNGAKADEVIAGIESYR